MSHKIEAYIQDKILMKSQKVSNEISQLFFENINVKEVSRTLNSSGAAYLIIETQTSLENQIAKKSAPELYLVCENDLEESARTFLRKFIPEDNSVSALLQRMDQEAGLKQSFMAELEIEVSKLAEEKM